MLELWNLQAVLEKPFEEIRTLLIWTLKCLKVKKKSCKFCSKVILELELWSFQSLFRETRAGNFLVFRGWNDIMWILQPISWFIIIIVLHEWTVVLWPQTLDKKRCSFFGRNWSFLFRGQNKKQEIMPFTLCSCEDWTDIRVAPNLIQTKPPTLLVSTQHWPG
jgi:hypothetical protein